MNKRLFAYGFTLVEILLVVAIIGVFMAVAIVMTSDARDESRDATIKQRLNNVVDQAHYLATRQGGFTNVCGLGTPPPEIVRVIDGAKAVAPSGATFVCNADADRFAISIELYMDGKHWCVDSGGARREIEDPLEDSIIPPQLECPSS